MTQEALAAVVRISTRHLSFVETGRACPSRELVLALADGLTMPLQDRNALLLSAGFAPQLGARSLDDPALSAERDLMRQVLRMHEPNPAVAVDPQWNLLAANRILGPLIAGVAPFLVEPPVNLLRLTLHPQGLAPRIDNLAEWRHRMLARLRRQYVELGTRELDRLLVELSAYPGGLAEAAPGTPAVAAPLRLNSPIGPLALVSTTMVFGAALDLELPGLAIETFLPADESTGRALQALARTLGEAS